MAPVARRGFDGDTAADFLAGFGDLFHFLVLPEGALKGKQKPAQRVGTYAQWRHGLCVASDKGCGIFYAPNEIQGPHRKTENVSRIRAFFVDLDGAPLEPIQHGPLEPQYIIETSPGHYHVYWLVTGNIPLEKFQPIQKRLISRFGGDKAVCDLPRVMRLPGSINHKRGGYEVRIIEENNIPPYTLDEIEKAFPREAERREEATSRVVNIEAYRKAHHSSQISQEPDFGKVVEGCAYIQHCLHEAATLSEPEWWSALSIAVHCADGERMAHELSRPYPTYSEAETTAKIVHAREAGKPHTCEYISENVNGDYCGECPNRGKVKSPISLGRGPAARSGADGEVRDEVAALNDQHAFIMVGGKAAILNTECDADGNPIISFSGEADYRKRYGNCYYTVTGPRGGSRNIYIADEWLRWPRRRQYDGICFRPARKVPDNYFNPWRGLALKPQKGSWVKMKQHILEVICDGDAEIYTYVLAYLARIVQDPGGERPGVSLVLQGQQGTGKGVLMRNFGALFGCHYLHVTSQDHLTGRFNLHLMHTVVLFVDEGCWGGDKSAEGKLKGLITEPTLQIEAKGKDTITSENHVNVIFGSNNDWVVPAGLEERRFLVLWVSSRYMQDHSYFEGLQEEMDNGGREAMLHDLLEMDISSINLRQVPRTQALRKQIEHSMHSVHKFWFEALQDGEIPMSQQYMALFPPAEIDTAWEGWHAKEYLYQAYLSHSKQLNVRYPADKSLFYRKVHEVCPSFRVQRETGGGRRPGYQFPPLEVCRREFESAIKMPVTWENLD